MKDFSVRPVQTNYIVRRIVILAAVIILLTGAAIGVYLNSKINQPRTFSSNEIIFTIEPGESSKAIANRLEDEGVISSALTFRWYVSWKSLAQNLQAGSFTLNSNMAIKEVAEQLSKGRGLADEIALTFSEGSTLDDIAKKLDQEGIVNANDFIVAAKAENFKEFAFLKDLSGGRNLEGYLFPDTYNFRKTETPEVVIAKMLNNFETRISQLDFAQENLHETIILASIVEKEVGRNVARGTALSDADKKNIQQERRIVAGVFKNRLAIGMALESDATVTYITQSGNRRATFAELETDSLYNTYKHTGLPPGPISNPSVDSVAAALNPAETNYLFFLSSPDGTMYFAETLEEHIENRGKYLE